MKRVFIIHGWYGNSEEGWFPWVRNELEKIGFTVESLNMPDPDVPQIEDWVEHLRHVVGTVDEHTYFIGHSIGCQTIMRYIQSLDIEKRVGGVVYVAGWFTLTGISDEEKPIAKPWLETPIDFGKVKTICPKSTAIFSKDDPYVPISNSDVFKGNLNADIIILETGGHLGGDSGITELPEVVEAFNQF